MELEVDRYCFVCGPENLQGLGVRFTVEEGLAAATYTIRAEHQGYTGVSHGGILAALLDEAMVYAAVSLGRWAATAEMTVRYHRPVPIGEPFLVEAEVSRQVRRLVECRAQILSADRTVFASATGKLMQGRPLSEVERTVAVRGDREIPGEQDEIAG